MLQDTPVMTKDHVDYVCEDDDTDEDYVSEDDDSDEYLCLGHLFHDEWVGEIYPPESLERGELEEVNRGERVVVTNLLSDSFVDWAESRGLQFSNGQLVRTVTIDPPTDVNSVDYLLNMSYEEWRERYYGKSQSNEVE